MTSLAELLARAYVAESGAVVLGEGIVADGHMPGALVRIVTHAHVDHLVGMRESLRETPFIAATPLTLEMLPELGYRIPRAKQLPLAHHIETELMGYRVKLLPANHIPGAAQVLVEWEDGFRVGYTGDFKQPGTPVMKDLDVLVIEATYGRPEHRRPWSMEIEYIFADLVRDLLVKGPVYIYAYHGKLQEAMRILREQGIDAPFIAPSKVYRIALIVKKHGIDVGEVLLAESREAKEVMRDGWYIYFTHMMNRRNGAPPTAQRVILSGWEFSGPYRQAGTRTWIVSLSDHADFDQLVEYVQEAKPKLVVVDAYREGSSEAFASYIRRHLGIPAVTSP
ncbi:hypothetical protein Pyrfu_1071 [Pyrolobus fumarii 1A]|uniref:Metallo-beta-lactamase domain-containing protein n=1 Tax=Pyrolobus fumarii (strain DSM 11204 / 1A) TaxID=694429 RepID=G0EF42_PYRF1|nr:MBL fold metallo-hydrolase [Pyrolobus fumarii]AEM38939.1 hypothetical protein Pyrfu_1071 [Pyrolobus fumarii 1A]